MRSTFDDAAAPDRHTTQHFELTGARDLPRRLVGRLSVNGANVAEAGVDRTVPDHFSIDDTFDVGED